MTANVDAMVRAGVEAFRNGNKDEARALLERAIEIDTYNELAWLWLSGVVETPEEQRTCLENVVVINPSNERARQGLQSLGVDPDKLINRGGSKSAGSSTASSTTSRDTSTSPMVPDRPAPPPPMSQNLFGDTDFSAAASFKFDDDILYGTDDFASEEYVDEVDTFGSGDDFYADRDTLNEFNDAVGSRLYDDEDDSDFARGSQTAVSGEKSPFAIIPKEIKPGRLPGTDEPAPRAAHAVIGVLSLLNIAAFVFLAYRLIV